MAQEFTLESNHISKALDRLIEQYKNAVNLQKMLSILVERMQLIENENYKFKSIYNIPTQTAVLLERIGNIVGQQRLGFSDDVYRLLIYAKIAINISGGTPENIINIFKIIVKASFVKYDELYPAGIQLQYQGEIIDPSLSNALVYTLDNALPAGVSVEQINACDDNLYMFTVAEKDDSINENQGFSDEDNPGTGGKLSEEIYIGVVNG